MRRGRANATAVVATVFLVDRLAKRLVAPGKWTAAVSNTLAALLCLSFPEAKRPRLSEWAEGYAGLRAAAGAASRFGSAPDLRASKQGLVGGLRRLSARLLKPVEEPEEARMEEERRGERDRRRGKVHDPSFWNSLLGELWPSLRGMIEEDILKGEENVTAALKFDSAFLGTEPPKDVNLTLKLTQGLAVAFANPPSLDLEVTTPTALSMNGTLPERVPGARSGAGGWPPAVQQQGGWDWVLD
eukprot:Skav210150  [mRNA]  locus=scaffold1755:84437:90698:- [translate_table: standard]